MFGWSTPLRPLTACTSWRSSARSLVCGRRHHGQKGQCVRGSSWHHGESGLGPFRSADYGHVFTKEKLLWPRAHSQGRECRFCHFSLTCALTSRSKYQEVGRALFLCWLMLSILSVLLCLQTARACLTHKARDPVRPVSVYIRRLSCLLLLRSLGF